MSVNKLPGDNEQSVETLLQTNERLAFAQRSAGAGMWEWDLVSNKLFWSPELFQLFGLDPARTTASFDLWRSTIHPDDSVLAEERIMNALRDRKPLFNEYRIISPSGKMCWINAWGNTTYDQHGEALRMSGICIDISQRKQAEEALQKAHDELERRVVERTAELAQVNETLKVDEARFRTVFENTNTGIASTDNVGKVSSFNETFRAMLDYDGETLGSMNFADFTHPEDLRLERIFFDEILAGQRDRYYITKRYIANGGRIIWVNLSAAALRDMNGNVTNFVAVVQDVTEHKMAQADKEKLEAQLQQVRKMESVGRLAGGVAHDFNNMLSVILGYADTVLQELTPSQSIYAYLIEIQKAARRSADLTRQLLAFARQQTVAPKVLDINAVVVGMLNMLHRLLGEDIKILWQPAQNLWPVMMDPSQFDQLMTNLCVNARDAIRHSGLITIKTENCVVDAHYCETHADAVVGEYVKLTVSDTGAGMDAETLAQIFEPFFTTKDIGKGSGLGLATVYGAVTQNGGFINVSSKQGQGTMFEIFLPRSVNQIKPAEVIAATDTVTVRRSGGETILLVEDEPTVLKITTLILKSKGYTVLEANSPDAAIDLARNYADKIHLLISDVIMPEMNGGALAATLQLDYPSLKCLFMSGYTADVIAQRGMLDDGVNFIHKPFSMANLDSTVRGVLDKK